MLSPLRSAPAMSVATILLSLIAAAACAAPYNPPVDQAGPLRVQIDGPAELTDRDQPFDVKLTLENSADAALNVQLAVGVIDDWSVDPGKPVDISVPARGTQQRTVQIQPGPDSYSAHYPIHVFARFTDGGRSHTAHPILVLETKFPSTAIARSTVAWKPITLRSNSALALWQVPIRRSVIEVFGRSAFRMPVGQLGSEPQSRADVTVTQQTLGNEARSVMAMHPPWYDGNAGTVALEFPIALPVGEPVKLEFANAMNPGGQSDGVTFRVRVAAGDRDDIMFGDVVFERHTIAKTWQPATVDLSQFAGKTIRLQLESHPGPSNNTGWDRCFWAEPTLVVGHPPAPLPFPPSRVEDSEVLGEIRSGDDTYRLRFWPGSRGLLDSVIGISSDEQSVYFHGFEVTVHNARLDRIDCPLQLTSVSRSPVAGGIQYRHKFEGPSGSFELVGTLVVTSGALQARFVIENAPPAEAWITTRLEDVSLGSWSRPLARVYAGAGNVLEKPGAFQLRFDGHRLSTSVVGYDFQEAFSVIESTNTPPLRLDIRPDRRHASLHATDTQVRTLIPAGSVWSGIRQWRELAGGNASAGVSKVAGRFVFDLWGGDYGPSAAELQKAFRYGLNDSMVVWHNWQRWGYDYRLPEIYPPNPRFGTEQELKAMIDACREAGVLFALHDNYIDYYPDADGFSYKEKIAFHNNGTPVLAWLNEGRGARSYRYRSDCIDPILKKNLQQIKEHLGPTAYFIDVWSSARPYEYWTADGKYFNSVYTRNTWGRLFAWIRDELGDDAPQISESGHDQLIGWLDGAQTNHLRVGKPMPGRYSWSVWDWDCADAERVAWFDAAHHDRFILHGAGYESRYVSGLDPKLHGIYSDDYIVTEMMTGHGAMVSRPFGRDVVRKYWLTHDVAHALALQTIAEIEFDEDNIHRQLVHWSSEGRVWANRGESDWEVDGTTLPQFGFLAELQMDEGRVTAAIERRDGVIVERCESPTACYFNARAPQPQGVPIELKVTDVHYSGAQEVTLDLQWTVGVPMPEGWVPFLHFCDERREIAFQATHRLPRGRKLSVGETRASAECRIPADCRPGEAFELCVGVYHPQSGRRLLLTGPDIGDRRIRVGHMQLDGAGDQVTGVTWLPYDRGSDPVLRRTNIEGRQIDFGMVVTSSGCRLTPGKDHLMVTPLPSVRPQRFDLAIRWERLPWRLPQATAVEAVDEEGRVLSKKPVAVDREFVRIDSDGRAFAFRLVP